MKMAINKIDKNNKEVFYSDAQYKKWSKNCPDSDEWSFKTYKVRLQ